MKTLASYHLQPQSGTSFVLRKGQVLRIIDPEGEQVADLIAYSARDVEDVLSSGRTLDYNNTIYVSTGHLLYSNKSNVMLTILEDTVGKHDFLLTPCSPDTFRILYDHVGYHPSCYENLVTSLAEFGIGPSSIPTTFNIFMNVDVLPGGELQLGPPLSRPGDYIDFQAEMDLIIGLTACSAEKSNNYRFKPIDAEIRG
ncbi:MAG: urea carboxylase-associated family protein [Chloroflexota bacterium]